MTYSTLQPFNRKLVKWIFDMNIPAFPEARFNNAEDFGPYRRYGQQNSPNNRHRSAKKRANRVQKAYTVASVGSSIQKGVAIGQVATSTSNFAGLAAATVTGASATGFGLLVVGGVMMIGGAVKDGVAWKKTKAHVRGLKEVSAGGASDCFHCNIDKVAVLAEHSIIKNRVLPYVISKKQSKQSRKAMSSFGAIAGGGLAQSLRGLAKGGWKKLRGTKGKNRRHASQWLTHHFLTHDCELSNAIVSELYSVDEMMWLKTQRPAIVVDLLMEKMKST